MIVRYGFVLSFLLIFYGFWWGQPNPGFEADATTIGVAELKGNSTAEAVLYKYPPLIFWFRETLLFPVIQFVLENVLQEENPIMQVSFFVCSSRLLNGFILFLGLLVLSKFLKAKYNSKMALFFLLSCSITPLLLYYSKTTNMDALMVGVFCLFLNSLFFIGKESTWKNYIVFGFIGAVGFCLKVDFIAQVLWGVFYLFFLSPTKPGKLKLFGFIALFGVLSGVIWIVCGGMDYFHNYLSYQNYAFKANWQVFEGFHFWSLIKMIMSSFWLSFFILGSLSLVLLMTLNRRDALVVLSNIVIVICICVLPSKICVARLFLPSVVLCFYLLFKNWDKISSKVGLKFLYGIAGSIQLVISILFINDLIDDPRIEIREYFREQKKSLTMIVQTLNSKKSIAMATDSKGNIIETGNITRDTIIYTTFGFLPSNINIVPLDNNNLGKVKIKADGILLDKSSEYYTNNKDKVLTKKNFRNSPYLNYFGIDLPEYCLIQ